MNKNNVERFKDEIIHHWYSRDPSTPVVHAMVGITYPDPDMEVIRVNSGAYVLEYVYDGELIVQHENKSFKASAGDFFILHQNKYHHYFSNPQKLVTKIWLVISCGGAYLQHLISDYNLSDIVHIPNYNNPEFLEKCLDAISTNKFNTGRTIEFLLHSMIADISDFLLYQGKKSLTSAEIVKNFLDQNLHTNMRIKNCCDYVGMGKSQLINIFKNSYGISPIAYYINAKITDSQHYLSQTDLSISDIAKSYAFSDVYHYSKTFKKIVGISPSKYRKIHKNHI